MKKPLTTIAVAAALTASLVGFSTAATGDQGRRLTGPICVGKSNLAPVTGKTIFGQDVTVPRAGQVRSVSVREVCRDDEVRRLGVALPIQPGTPGAPGTPGNNGSNGAKGDKGNTGSAGSTGATGQAGQTGAAGETGTPGTPGVAGPTGATGATGEAGTPGTPGADGEDGLGNGTMTICLAGNGGINQAPCQGNQTAVEVVIVNAS